MLTISRDILVPRPIILCAIHPETEAILFFNMRHRRDKDLDLENKMYSYTRTSVLKDKSKVCILPSHLNLLGDRKHINTHTCINCICSCMSLYVYTYQDIIALWMDIIMQSCNFSTNEILWYGHYYPPFTGEGINQFLLLALRCNVTTLF